MPKPQAEPRPNAAPPHPFWYRQFYGSVDVSSLVFLRIAFGLVMAWEVWCFFSERRIATYFTASEFHFKYYGFDWIDPWPGEGMYVHFTVLGVLALFVALGFCYRLSAALFFVGYTYAFLAEQAAYQNHYYLICLVSFLMALVPANAALSLDARLGLTKPRAVIPAWPLLLLRFQVGVVYFFGGLAKLNADWLAGEPMRMWLHGMRDYPLIGPWLDGEPAVWFFSASGIAFDLTIPFLLAWRRTRAAAFAVTVLFHLTNAVLFDIGVFPLLAVALSTVYLSPGWFRKIINPRWLPDVPRETVDEARVPWGTPRETAVALFVALWAAFQCLVPMRRQLYPGNTLWTEQGHRFAWRMKLRDKRGRTRFLVKDGVEPDRVVNPRAFLTRFQVRRSAGEPDMLLQAAHRLAELETTRRGRPVEVYVLAWVSLNGRPYRLLIDPNRNLAAEADGLGYPDWLLPLQDARRPAK